MAQTIDVGPLSTFEEVLAECLDDPAFRAEWARTALARAVALRVLGYRIEHGLTLTGMGRLLGLSPRAIVRLESGDQSPTMETLVRLTERLGMSFLVEIRPVDRQRSEPPTTDAARIVQRVTAVDGAEIHVATS